MGLLLVSCQISQTKNVSHGRIEFTVIQQFDSIIIRLGWIIKFDKIFKSTKKTSKLVL